MSQISASFKATIIGLQVLSGAINTIDYKFQNKQFVYEGPYYKYFFHPFVQSATIFLSELLVLIAFFLLKRRNPEKYKMDQLQARSKGKQIKMNKFLLAIPAMCDFVGSTLLSIALNFVPGSVYQMMAGGTIITTFIYSIFYLKTKVNKIQVFGSVLAFLGISIVGISNMIFSDSDSGSGSQGLQIIGYITIVISLFFTGFQLVFEQKLLNQYHLDPMQVVGYEGLFAFSAYMVFLPICSYIPCNFGVDACVFDDQGFSFLDKPFQYFIQLSRNPALLFFCILGIFSISIFNIAGVTVTKNINALARTVADVSRTIIIWGVGLIVTATAGSIYVNYQWQLINLASISIQLIGFLLLVLGNLVYNELIKLPWVKKDDLQKRSLLEGQSQIYTSKN